MRKNLYKIIILALILLIVYDTALYPSEYFKTWFAILWGVVASLTILRLEVKDFLGGRRELHLPPGVQLLLALTLVLGAGWSTEWARLSVLALTPWVYVLFTLPFYQSGFAWGWARLRSKLAG
jgi:phosphatidylserine synthase